MQIGEKKTEGEHFCYLQISEGLLSERRYIYHVNTREQAAMQMYCCDPHGLQPASLLCPRDSPGKNPGVGRHFLLQGIFSPQGSNPHLLHLLHWQVDSLPPRHQGNWVLAQKEEKDQQSQLSPKRKNCLVKN